MTNSAGKPLLRFMLCTAGITCLHAGCDGTDGQGLGGFGRTQPTAEQVANMPTEPHITEVAAYYDPFDPWLWSEDRSQPRGIRVNALYLVGPKGKGVFGRGIIRPRLYVLEKQDDGSVEPNLVQEWYITPEDAIPFRVKKLSVPGWAYQLYLPWDDDVKLAGKEIRMIVGFEREDGQFVQSGKKDFKVPARRR